MTKVFLQEGRPEVSWGWWFGEIGTASGLVSFGRFGDSLSSKPVFFSGILARISLGLEEGCGCSVLLTCHPGTFVSAVLSQSSRPFPFHRRTMYIVLSPSQCFMSLGKMISPSHGLTPSALSLFETLATITYLQVSHIYGKGTSCIPFPYSI